MVAALSWQLFTGLALLALPGAWLLGESRRVYDYADVFVPATHDARYRRRRLRWLLVALADGLRAALALLALQEGLARLAAAGVVSGGMARLGLTALVAGGALCQLPARGNRHRWIGPVGYYAGVVLALLPGVTGPIVLIAGLLCMLALRQTGAYFVGGALAIVPAYHFFHLNIVTAAAMVIVWLTPAMVAWLTQRELALLTRTGSNAPTAHRGN